MAAVSFLTVFSFLVCLSISQHLRAFASPLAEKRNNASSTHFVVYGDALGAGHSIPSASDIAGFNVFALSFWLLSGAADQALAWSRLSDAERSTIKSQYAAAGIKIVVSLFGSTNTPTTSGADPIAIANAVAAWVEQYGVDGVDVDYEDFSAMEAGDGRAEAWLVSFTQQLRAHLPQGSYLLTHAPIAPWFTPGRWAGGGYSKVHSTVGHLIDWYNVQFYNQGIAEYTTCDGLLTVSSAQQPQSALFQVASNGVPLSKLVIGKPADIAGANNGFMDPPTLATCLMQAKNKGWSAGVMVWQFTVDTPQWIRQVRSLAFPE